MEWAHFLSKCEKYKVLIIVGPSGVGKDTIMRNIYEKYHGYFKKFVGHTTRKMRIGEKEGYNCYYISKEKFLKLKDEGYFFEWNYFNGNYYGLSKKELENGIKGDKILFMIIEINGAELIYKLNIPANFIAILPPCEDILEKRLKNRGTESEEFIKERVERAKNEIKKINKSNFFKYKIINDNLEKTILDLEKKIKILYPHLKLNFV